MTPHPSTTTDRERRLDEAIAEYLEAVDSGSRPDPARWLARFPDLADELARFFASQEQVRSLLLTLGPAAPADDRTTAHGSGPPPVVGEAVPYFGDYELLEEVARGGMGVVYRARQVSLNRTVALKMILAGRLASGADVQRFRNEAEAAAHLDHPHIVPIFEVGEHEGQHYFTMKFVEGGNLGSLGRLPPSAAGRRRAAELVATVARAVHYAHQRGILHRDLKPANLLIDADGQPHLTDFGLARRLGNDPGLTRSGAIVGTPSYMAPEQAAGPAAVVTTAADVYSLGAILYELLVGRPPFRGEHPLETLRMLLEREPDRLRSVDPRIDRDLETVCLKCLEKDPARRYGSALELAEDLERYLAGEPVRGRRAGSLERLARWCRRRPLAAALSMALALSLAAGAGLITWQWQRAEAHLVVAEEERQQAERERARAEEAFREAHKAVNDFCTKVSEGRMRDAPGLQPERRELLLEALAYYQRFLKERGHDPALRRELADIHARIGTITDLLGPKAQALEAYGLAMAGYEELLRDDPGSLSLRQAQAETQARMADLQKVLGRPEALATYEEAVRRYEALLKERPDDPSLLTGTAAVLNNLSLLHRWAGRVPDALACLRRARDLQEELVRRLPGPLTPRANLALTCCNLASLEAAVGHRTEVMKLYNRARGLQEKLVKDDPVSFRYQQELAATYRQLGGELCREKQFDEALRILKQSQDLLERLIRAEPQIAGLKSDLASGCRQTGHAYRDSGKPKPALAQYERALALMDELTRDHPEVADYRNDLAKCHFDRAGVLARLGRHEDARRALVAAAELRRALVADHPAHVGYQSDLGLTLGNLATAEWNLGRHAEALAAQRDCLQYHKAAFTGAPEVTRYRGYLNGAYARLAKWAAEKGHFEESLTTTLDRQKLWPGSAAELYGVAADLARLAGTWPAGLDKGDPADRAVAALREAVAAGFRDGPRLRDDPAFAAFRGRADFQAILSELGVGKEGK
jgi:tetratricopeptide (TPR) repeat protein